MVLYEHRSIYVLYPRVLIPAPDKVIKPWLYQICLQKTGSCFWSVSYTRSKNPFSLSKQWAANFQISTIWANAFFWYIQNKFSLSKNGIAKQYCISLEKENYNDIGTPLDFCQENDFRITNTNLLTTLVFGRSNHVRDRTLW